MTQNRSEMDISSKIEGILIEKTSFERFKVNIQSQNNKVATGILSTQHEKFFLKYFSGQVGSEMCSSEAEGIRALKNTGYVQTTGIIEELYQNDFSLLVLQNIEIIKPNPIQEAKTGEQLAVLHKIPFQLFGWGKDNFIGLLPQFNGWNENWADFYFEKRLKPQFELAQVNKYLSETEIPGDFEIRNFLSVYISDVTPSLLHGDLWHGNLVYSSDGLGYFIDPSVYYGDSDMDIAMTLLFGGFGNEFYTAYHKVRPKSENFEIRIQLYQLYYLLVHLNLYGFSYKPVVKNLLKMFC